MTLAFEIPKQPYSGRIGTTTVGTGKGSVTLGGAESYPFYLFEGKMPNTPKIAMEIWDYDPSKEWPAASTAPFKDVISSPDAWAKKCVDQYGADLIVLQMKAIDPNGMDRSPSEEVKVVKKVMDAVNVPVVVWGTANNQKDEEVLKSVSETCQGKNLALAPVEEGNHKGVGASALGYGHVIVASSPIDVNLAKQLNILLGNLGLQSNKILIDPTTGGLGYGMEYSYSVMERIRMAALTQEDDKLQFPMISNVGNEVWKSKEAGQSIEDAPALGDPERRAIMMECVAAVCYLLAGSDVVILRHPESVKLVRSFIDRMVKGGSIGDVQGITKNLALKEADLLSLAPAPNLDFAKEVPSREGAKPKEAKAAPAKVEKKPEKPKAQEKVVELKPKTEEIEPEKEALTKAQEEAKAKAAAEAKAKSEAKAKEEAEGKAKAEAEAKAKGEEEAKVKAADEARKKAAAAKEKEKDDLEALRQKRAAAKEKQQAQKPAPEAKPAKAQAIEPTPEGKAAKAQAIEPESMVDKMIQYLDRIHRRA
jgi:acetyl-CoA decarbonylase/synthase, CODH/ACS complex subunit delta